MLSPALVWLVLGYAFYCWVYAAAGSMAERQDQVQSLALPLSIPIMFGYIFSLTTASSGNASPSSSKSSPTSRRPPRSPCPPWSDWATCRGGSSSRRR